MNFLSNTHINLDAKGRFAMPATYRMQLGRSEKSNWVVTTNSDGCLWLYPMSGWEAIETKIRALPNTTEAMRNLQRSILGTAEVLDMDAQGRVRLPAFHRGFANLDKKIVLVGVGSKLEIWQEESWELRLKNIMSEELLNSKETAEVLSQLSL